MLFIILCDINVGIYTSLTTGSLFETTPTGLQFELFYGKKIFCTNITYSFFISSTYYLGYIENGYGVYTDIFGFKTGFYPSFLYFNRVSILGGKESGYASLISFFIKKYIKLGTEYISINLKMSEVFDDFGFDIVNIGISFGLQ